MSCATPVLPSGSFGHVPETAGHVAEIAGHDPETAGHLRPKYAGKRVEAAIRQLGYPTKNSLKSWHLEYERRHDLRTGYVRLTPKYSAEQKKVAVDHYLGRRRCAAATLRALGYPSRGTLAAWLEELHPEFGQRIVGRATGSLPKSPARKQAAVIELCTREDSARVLAQKASLSRPTLYNWKNQLLGRDALASETPEEASTGQ